jgi:hypothetical protein
MPNDASPRRHTTQAHEAYEPPHVDVTMPFRLLVAGLLVAAVGALAVHQVCPAEVPGANERGLGVSHEQRGTGWYHCEPWIRRALGG